MEIVITLLIGSIVIGLIAGRPWLKRWQWRQIQQKPFPREWRKILRKNVPFFSRMPADLQLQLKNHIAVFIAEKRFVGCNGVRINDEVKVTIAAQACLLLLNRPTDYYARLESVLVYPRSFVANNKVTDAAGVENLQTRVLQGESWDYGKVVLSWSDSLAGGLTPDDGHNVVIHEFAHQLDQEHGGKANGAPLLPASMTYEEWSNVFKQAYDALLWRLNHNNEESVLSQYATTNPAEFFAVASEAFFEKPVALSDEFPSVYQQLKQFYAVDPLLW